MLPASEVQYRNFKIHSPPLPQPGKAPAFDYFIFPGVGNLTGMAFPGPGILLLTGWGEQN